VHYPPYVNNIVDSSKVYLKLTTSNLREVGIASALNHTAPSLQNGPLVIPANQIKSFNAKYTVPVDISVFALAPHMHLVGSSIKAFGVNAPGDTNRLVNIPNWDFHWQRTYTFPKVQKLPKNMVLWANASSNKLSPNNPPKLVSLGEGTADEMLLVYLWYTLYQTGDENIVIDAESPKNISSIVRVNGNNNVSAFPNPANENIHISGWMGDQSNTEIYLYNLNGAMVKTAKATFEESNITVSVKDLQPAIYFLRISDGNHQQTMPIVKE
jgi:Secretion system C-terminal sorting domain/Copper type II ascorbate-dependent monooxygenase, C-terminal domain